MKFWKKQTHSEITERIRAALNQNQSFYKEPIFGMPCSYLDPLIFPESSPILADAPYLQTLINNPNHIGCHTLATSETIFSGTQEIEKYLIELCSVDIFKANEQEIDGYVASGGTESNIQALWVYRNYFLKEFNATNHQISVCCSFDTHYSIVKGCDLLSISLHQIPVMENRQIRIDVLIEKLAQLKKNGVQNIIYILNMMTTMFGSVDESEAIIEVLKQSGLNFKIHVDGAYGGFFYPFSNPENSLNFENENINSITVDAHKMVQAPYGTGIFLIRKGFMKYTHTSSAKYVKGEDYTLVGSRSGANAIAVWMILMKHGPYGWIEKVNILLHRAKWLENELNKRSVCCFRENYSNIITIKAEHLNENIIAKYYLVPDSHDSPAWYKIVIMDHVNSDLLHEFLLDLGI